MLEPLISISQGLEAQSSSLNEDTKDAMAALRPLLSQTTADMGFQLDWSAGRHSKEDFLSVAEKFGKLIISEVTFF